MKGKIKAKATQAVAAATFSSNFRTEEEALNTTTAETNSEKHIICADVKSVVSILQNKSKAELADLRAVFH